MILNSSLKESDIEVDRKTVDSFLELNEDNKLNDIAFVIPAYKEKDNIENVIKFLPEKLIGYTCSTVVVVDGDDDGTAQISKSLGALIAVAPVNRGQGAALRTGYIISKQFGAKFIVTIDGDGQCNPNDIAGVLEPIVDGCCDLVLGSRIKGANNTTDRTRNLGVTVFARIISVLCGQYLTDTANPLRAMTAEFANSITLTQNQFQASEVIIDALLGGYRVTERPMTMNKRMSGKSKKGKNISYGLNYSKALLNTYFREKLKLL